MLKRNISSIAGDGNVIRVSNGSTLTIQDCSGNNSGQITGGFSSDGGGIYNSGTLYFKGGTITGCRVDHEGGAILNSGIMTMSGGVITACRGNDCGGIYNAAGSTLTIIGGTITGCFSNAGGGAEATTALLSSAVAPSVTIPQPHAAEPSGRIVTSPSATASSPETKRSATTAVLSTWMVALLR